METGVIDVIWSIANFVTGATHIATAMSERCETFLTLRELLSQAIKNNDQSSVERLLIACSPNRYPFACISSLLEIAIKHNRLEIIKLLINKGACVKSPRNSFQHNALHIAAIYRNKDAIVHILGHDVDWFTVDINGANVLHLTLAGIENNKEIFNPITSRDEHLIIEILQIFLGLGLDVNECTKFSECPLELAIKNGMLKVAKFLIKNGADPYIYNRHGDRLLHMLIKFAVKTNKISNKDQILNFVKWLQFEGIDINIPNSDEITPLQLAIKQGLESMVSILMELTDDLNAVNTHGQGNLHVVLAKFYDCKFGSDDSAENSTIINMIKKMLNKAADVNIVDKNGNTPLHIAAKQKNDQLIRIMLKYFTNVNAQSNWGETVLHIFIGNCIDINGKFEKNYEQYVRTVLSRGADVNIKNGKGMTPAQLAVQQRHDKILKILVEFGADLQAQTEDGDDLFQLLIRSSIGIDEPSAYKNIIDILLSDGFDIDEVDNNGQTLLHRATMWADLQLIEVLLEKGAKVNFADRSLRQLTPLHIAIQLRSAPVIMTLLKFGADVNILTKDGESPLIMAIPKFQVKLISTLLVSGARVNVTNKDGDSPLMKAARKGEMELIKLLLDYGADVNFRNKTSKFTALHIAANENQADTINFLVKAGAEVNVRNELGETPLHLGARHQSSVVETLVELGAKTYLVDHKNRLALHKTLECNNVVGLHYLLSNGHDINELGNIQFRMSSLLYNEDTHAQMRTYILQHLIKLHAANLLVPRLDEDYIRMQEHYHEQCVNEVRKMKEEFFGPGSMYDFIHIKPESRLMYKKVFLTFSIHKSFPIYFTIIKAKRDEALERKKLLELATPAWYEITNVGLPDLCLERIFDYTKNDTLKHLIQYVEETL